MNFPLEYYQIVNLINAILSAIIGLFVLLTRNRSKQIIQFGLFAFFVVLWDTFYYLAFQFNNYRLSAILFRSCMIAGALILPMFTEFVYTFVGKEIEPVYRWLNWGITAIIISTIYTNLYAFDGGPFLVFYYWPTIGVMSFVQILLYGVNVYYSHRELLRLCATGNYLQKNPARIMLYGTSLGYFGAATNFLLWFRIPFPPVFNILIPVYVFSVAYAITKHRLMDISVIISRTIAELLSVVFMGSVYVGLVWLYRNSISATIDIPFIAWTILYGILVGLTHQPIRLFIQTTSDKVFLKGKYNYYNELSDISGQITRSLSVENILQTLQKTFYEVIEVSNPRIYIEDDLNKNEIKDYLSYKGPIIVKKDLILPCRVEDRLIALIILGPKLSEDEYTDEDLRLLRNIANQTAVALDHHRMYEDMLKAQKQILTADKLTELGNVAANFANQINPSLLRLEKLTDVRGCKEVGGMTNKEEITEEINHINGLIESILKPIRKGNN